MSIASLLSSILQEGTICFSGFGKLSTDQVPLVECLSCFLPYVSIKITSVTINTLLGSDYGSPTMVLPLNHVHTFSTLPLLWVGKGGCLPIIMPTPCRKTPSFCALDKHCFFYFKKAFSLHILHKEVNTGIP